MMLPRSMAATNGPPWVASCHRPARRLGRPVAVGEIGVAALQEQRALVWAHLVPAELRHAHIVGKPADMAVDEAEPAHAGVLVAGLEQELVADADGDGRAVRLDPRPQGAVQPVLDQALHGRTERADARQHDMRRFGDVRHPLAHSRLGTESPECGHDRSDVRGAGRDDDDLRHRWQRARSRPPRRSRRATA